MGHIDNGSGSSDTLKIYLDEEFKEEVELKSTMLTQTVQISTKGVKQPRLYWSVARYKDYGIANIQRYKQGATSPSTPTVTPSPSTPTPISTVVTDLKEGYYVIKSSLDTNYVLEIEGALTSAGANCQIYQRNSSTGQIFYIKKISDGYYTITVKCSNINLDVLENGMTSGTNICQSTSHGGENQQRKIYKNTSLGTYQFQARSNSLYMEVSGNVVSNRANVLCNSYK